jgi:hypothetical protein
MRVDPAKVSKVLRGIFSVQSFLAQRARMPSRKMKPGPKPRPWNTTNRSKLIRVLQEYHWGEIKPSQYATLHGLSASHVRKLCAAGKIPGAHQTITRYWIIPYSGSQ